MTTITTRKPAIEVSSTNNGTFHSTIRLDFANGKTITVETAMLQEGIIQAALAHGLKQKLVDAAAISRDPDTGRAATIDTKFEAVDEVFQRLIAGQWNKSRAGEGGGATGGLLLRALMSLYAGRKTKEELLAFIGTKTDAEKAALRASPKVAPLIAQIKALDAAGKVSDINSDDLLADLA